MKKLSWLSVEDYGTTPLEILIGNSGENFGQAMTVNSLLEFVKKSCGERK